MSFETVLEGLKIFDNYRRILGEEAAKPMIAVQHDMIYAGLNNDDCLTGADQTRLKAIGWMHGPEGWFTHV